MPPISIIPILFFFAVAVCSSNGHNRRGSVRHGRSEPEKVVAEHDVVPEVTAKISTIQDEVVKYSGHRLFRMRIISGNQLQKLRHIQRGWSNKACGAVEFWDEPLVTGQEVTIRVAPSSLDPIRRALESVNVTYSTLTDDLQKWIDKEANDNVSDEDGLGLRDGDFNLGMYHTLKEINESLVMLHQKYQNNTRLLVLGNTSEGRQITGIRIGTGEADRPAIFIDGAMHAREWISPATLVYLMHRLLENTTEEPKTYGLIDLVDWYIFPVVNPDGYEYSWKSNRLWRKNRRKTTRFSLFCRGVDPNRNFGVQFGRRGSSANPCAENYGGTSAFSEKESQAVKNGILRLKHRIVAYLNVHSYSQVLMSPYGYTRTKPSAYADQEAAMKVFTDGLRMPFNATYRFGTAAETMYHTSGAAIDWVYDVAKVKYSLVLELRDKGQFGFILPREFIIPSGMELVQGFRKFVEFLDKRKELVVKQIDPGAAW